MSTNNKKSASDKIVALAEKLKELELPAPKVSANGKSTVGYSEIPTSANGVKVLKDSNGGLKVKVAFSNNWRGFTLDGMNDLAILKSIIEDEQLISLLKAIEIANTGKASKPTSGVLNL